MRVALAASLVAASLCLSCASVTSRAVERAWLEAGRRAGIPARAAPPEVVWGARALEDCGGAAAGPGAAARYLPDVDRVEILSLCRHPAHVLLVHEFLHAIRERARREGGSVWADYEPEGEEWVRARAAERGGEASDREPQRAARTPANPILPSTIRR